MAQQNPYSIQLQISRMYQEGQSLFAPTKVQDWLKQRNENPADYLIKFIKQPAPVGSRDVISVKIDITRKDGEPVADWILQQLAE
jgi:hypothetical protein